MARFIRVLPSFVVTRKVGKRTYLYTGKGENGKPKYTTEVECQRAPHVKVPQTYTRKDNAQRAVDRLRRADVLHYWGDNRRQVGEFEIKTVSTLKY